jgi:DNA-binding transcriptional regulator LsrR (DeoR family)
VSLAFGNDPLIQAAWLYYIEQMTQQDIANFMGLSRATIANYLADARRRGLVTITVHPELLSSIEASGRLAARWGLTAAHVLPMPCESSEERTLRARLGRAGAAALLPLLANAKTLGVAWGRTMLELARAMPEQNMPGLKVVQVSGSSLGDADSSPEACSALIANRLGARCQNFHAPAVVSNAALRNALLAEPSLRRQLDRVAACDVVVFGVGELSRDVTWSDADTLRPEEVEHYLAAGCKAVLIGRFLTADGREADGPLSGRQIGMELDQLKRVPIRVCVAGGAEKLDALRAMLAGGYATHLVTDAETAERLCEL